jgi:trehalose 6-phosphate phosphatase
MPMGDWRTIVEPPVPARTHAVFLDFDGTLIELAAVPDAVIVPDGLAAVLSRASEALSGALCIVSGRSMEELNRYLPRVAIDFAAEHGAVLSHVDAAPPPGAKIWPPGWENVIAGAALDLEGVTVERKPRSVAFHFRKRPNREARLAALGERLMACAPDAYEMIASKMTVEIKSRLARKGAAIAAMMERSAYRGRVPVFVADDESDNDGFEMARRLGGIALHVDHSFGGRPANVRRWLEGYGALRSAAA